MGAQRAPGPAVAGGLGEDDRERLERRIDLVLVAIGDRRGLVVGALDEAYGGFERQEPAQVGRRPAEVRLEGDADRPVIGLQLLVQVDRRLDIRRALHVEPEPGADLLGPGGQRLQVGKAGGPVDVEPELGRLDRDLDGPRQGRAPVEHGLVVRGDLVGFVERGQVLAEAREQDALAGRRERGRCREAGIDVLAGHEPPDGAAHEAHLRQARLEPARCEPSRGRGCARPPAYLRGPPRYRAVCQNRLGNRWWKSGRKSSDVPSSIAVRRSCVVARPEPVGSHVAADGGPERGRCPSACGARRGTSSPGRR